MADYFIEYEINWIRIYLKLIFLVGESLDFCKMEIE